MLKKLLASEIAQIVKIFDTAVANRSDPAIVMEQVFALHRLSAKLIISCKADSHGLIIVLLLVLEHPDCYELLSDKPPLTTEVIQDLCANNPILTPPILSLPDLGSRFTNDLNV